MISVLNMLVNEEVSDVSWEKENYLPNIISRF